MATTASTQTRAKKSYFDLHIEGVGYVNRIREVTPKRGAAFLACEVAALVGPTDAVEYRRFDVRVSGTDAQHLIRRCEQAVKDEKKVLIGFRLGDLWTDIFTYSKGPKEGQTGVSLKARLLFISWIKVDGEIVYKAEPKATDAAAEETDTTESLGETRPDPSVANTSGSAEAPQLAASA
jgi:Protein of unknown function (DUF3577)